MIDYWTRTIDQEENSEKKNQEKTEEKIEKCSKCMRVYGTCDCD